MTAIFCIVPARSGSKRIPNKNIQPINGVPLIAFTLAKLFEADVFTNIVVSTDSLEIQDISIKSGAQCPSLRPKEISDDLTPTIDVIKHALNSSPEIHDEDVVACVYPTAALLPPSIYKLAIAKFLKRMSSLSFLISVAAYSHPIQRSIQMDSQSKIKFIEPAFLKTRTQDLVKTFYDAGQFYIAQKSLWLSSNSVFENACGFEIPPYSFIDLDYPEDLEELRKRLG